MSHLRLLGSLFCLLLRLAGITVEVFLPASSRGRHRINAHRTHTNIHASSGIRTLDLSVGAGEGSSCLRPRGHCDRLYRPSDRPFLAKLVTIFLRIEGVAWSARRISTVVISIFLTAAASFQVALQLYFLS
jgi:hypothetical protein